MAELTEEQFKRAHRLLLENGYAVSGTLLEEVAGLLQMPWNEPSDDEIKLATADSFGFDPDDVPQGRQKKFRAVARNFVRRRNAALQPKLVDPRREAVVKALMELESMGIDYVADRIVAALDGVAATPKFGFTGFEVAK